MFKKLLKWGGIVIGGLAGVGIICYAYISWNISGRMKKKYVFAPEHLAIPKDSTTMARGKHLVAIKGCTDCHGTKLEGRVMADDGAIGRLSATNLTKGMGGLAEDYSSADWLMALRHGVNRKGQPLLLMPSHETTLLTEQDMAALIAYCEDLPPIDNHLPENKIGPVARIMTYLDKMPLLSVEKIAHDQPMPAPVDTARGIALGKYLSVSCSGCHRPDMRGGEPLAPGFPPVPDITSSGHVGQWTEAEFMHTLRTGKTPSGHQMKPDDMPWTMTAQYDEKELASLYAYLKSL